MKILRIIQVQSRIEIWWCSNNLCCRLSSRHAMKPVPTRTSRFPVYYLPVPAPTACDNILRRRALRSRIARNLVALHTSACRTAYHFCSSYLHQKHKTFWGPDAIDQPGEFYCDASQIVNLFPNRATPLKEVDILDQLWRCLPAFKTLRSRIWHAHAAPLLFRLLKRCCRRGKASRRLLVLPSSPA